MLYDLSSAEMETVYADEYLITDFSCLPEESDGVFWFSAGTRHYTEVVHGQRNVWMTVAKDRNLNFQSFLEF